MKHRLFSQRGFTLIEVIAAFTIITMMVSVVYGILFVSKKTQRAHDKKLQRYALIRRGLARLEMDLSMAYLSLGEDQNQVDRRTYFKAAPEAGGTDLSFSTFSHVKTYRKAKEADNCIVQYTLVDDPVDAGRFLLTRRETHRLENKPPSEIPGEAYPLIPGVSYLHMEFYDKQNDEWLEEWDTTTVEGKINKLPNQIKIHLVVDNGTNHLVHFHTMVFPKLTDAINLIPSGDTTGSYMQGGGSKGSKDGSGSSRTPFSPRRKGRRR